MERLRHVARSGRGSDEDLVLEAAGALMACVDDPGGLLTACRRIVARIPDSAPIVQLCARMIMAPDPAAEARTVVRDNRDDRTFRELAALIPPEACVALVATSPALARALSTRGDLDILVLDVASSRVFTALLDLDVPVVDVPPAATGPAMSAADLAVIEGVAWGPERWLVPTGAFALAATARATGRPVWATVAAGRVLPGRMFDGLVEGAIPYDPWDAELEVVPIEMVDLVVGPDGQADPASTGTRADCPIAPEIFGGRV